MKISCSLFALGMLALSFEAPARAAELGTEMRIDEPSRGGAAPLPQSGGTMCAKTDEIVFSCPLDRGKKTASMCASGDIAGGTGRFYYSYGHGGSPELVYPASGESPRSAFTRTHLGFAGNTGGYAYGFSNKGFKYTIYSMSGERNLQNGGVIVQRASDSKVMAKMSCQAGKITETESDPLIDATLKWKSDSAIESNGLPTR